MVNTRTVHGTSEMLTNNAKTAAAVNEGGAVGILNATAGEATPCDNVILVDAVSSSAGTVVAGADKTVSRDATSNNAVIDDCSPIEGKQCTKNLFCLVLVTKRLCGKIFALFYPADRGEIRKQGLEN
ncbi:hypothetical protein QAD02_006794 [Eretmocerus hayati]|uniref:Uncharacterized protein n=1 Tax=Eretmocerus hayati TaxID=131215 RepID=A0ACC2N1W7_9HYME|nr:hypothetical protein QAD02_006794 [Eretmocerus hayati]